MQGEQLYAVAVKILAEEHEFQNRLADISEKSIGNLKLGIPSYRGQICLPEILPRFYAKWPQISRLSSAMNPPIKWKNVSTMGNLIFLSGVMYQDNPKLESSTLLTDPYLPGLFRRAFAAPLSRFLADLKRRILKRRGAGTFFKNSVPAPSLPP